MHRSESETPAPRAGRGGLLLPSFWRFLNQLMPPGAGGTSLKNTAYFDGNAVAGRLLVLSTYAVGGFLLVLLGETIRRRRAEAPGSTEATSDSSPELKKAA